MDNFNLELKGNEDKLNHTQCLLEDITLRLHHSKEIINKNLEEGKHMNVEDEIILPLEDINEWEINIENTSKKINEINSEVRELESNIKETANKLAQYIKKKREFDEEIKYLAKSNSRLEKKMLKLEEEKNLKMKEAGANASDIEISERISKEIKYIDDKVNSYKEKLCKHQVKLEKYRKKQEKSQTSVLNYERLVTIFEQELRERLEARRNQEEAIELEQQKISRTNVIKKASEICSDQSIENEISELNTKIKDYMMLCEQFKQQLELKAGDILRFTRNEEDLDLELKALLHQNLELIKDKEEIEKINNILYKESKEIKKEIADLVKKKNTSIEDCNELGREIERILREIKSLKEGSANELVNLKNRIIDDEKSLKESEDSVRNIGLETETMKKRVELKKKLLVDEAAFTGRDKGFDQAEFLNTENCMIISERTLDDDKNEYTLKLKQSETNKNRSEKLNIQQEIYNKLCKILIDKEQLIIKREILLDKAITHIQEEEKSYKRQEENLNKGEDYITQFKDYLTLKKGLVNSKQKLISKIEIIIRSQAGVN